MCFSRAQATEDGLAMKDNRDSLRAELKAIREAQSAIDTAAVNESDADKQTRRELLAVIDANKKKRAAFRQTCREGKAKFEAEIVRLHAIEQHDNSATESEDESGELVAQVAAAQKKLDKVRLQLAKRNKMVAMFQRKLDDVPGRAELTQYQKRFVELYDQVAAKHIETKKFYMLHNTLDDTRVQLEMELKLLNNVYDSYMM